MKPERAPKRFAVRILGFTVLFPMVFLSFFSLLTNAQSRDVMRQGSAVTTGFSGMVQWDTPEGSDPVDFQIINLQGVTLNIFDLAQMYGLDDDARLVPARKSFSVSATDTGQIFGVALDDGSDQGEEPTAPNIYVTATSAYGLQILSETPTQVLRSRKGGPDAKWMDGQFGPGNDGGPGSVWKIDGRTGDVTLFANITFNGLENTGPALGNIAFDRNMRRLYVSDLQTGKIHGFDLDGNEIGIFDHGETGRKNAKLAPIPFDPSVRKAITSPEFHSEDPETWGFAPPERRVWGLATHESRLYYSVANGPDIWSVDLAGDGTFGDDVRLEITVAAASGDPVSDIEFGADGTMYLAQRGPTVSSYDFKELAKPGSASVLRYTKKKKGDGSYLWETRPEEYAIGVAGEYRNADGGVALGYGYYPDGYIRFDTCSEMLWATGEQLRKSDNPETDKRLGDKPRLVNGLQGNHTRFVRERNSPPFRTFHIDFDDRYPEEAAEDVHGYLGDVAIWSDCAGSYGDNSVADNSDGSGQSGSSGPGSKFPRWWNPRVPGQADIQIETVCSPAAFGGSLLCSVTLINVGDAPPTGAVSFTDNAEAGFGPTGSLTLFSVRGDGPEWKCSPVPANSVTCTLPGSLLEPSVPYTVDIIIDISDLVSQFGWEVTNYASLSTNGREVYDTVGNEFILTKSVPNTCFADSICAFDITIANNGDFPFYSDVEFDDNLTINGLAAFNVQNQGIRQQQGCIIPSGGFMPLNWRCYVSIPARGYTTFTVNLYIPKSAAPATGSVPARNCIVLAQPALARGNKLSPIALLAAILGGSPPSSGAGSVCVDFFVSAANPLNSSSTVAPPSLSPWPVPPGNCKYRPHLTTKLFPTSFSYAGEPITFEYRVRNTTTCPIWFFRIKENIQPSGALSAGAKLNCATLAPRNPTGVGGMWGTWFGNIVVGAGPALNLNDEVVCTSIYLTNAATTSVTNNVTLEAKW